MTTSPAADHGTDAPIRSLEWQLTHFARTLAEHRDRYAAQAAEAREKDDLLGEMCHRSETSIYGDVLEALHIWTDGQYGVRR